MSPRRSTITRERVLDAAVALVRRKGFRALTARAVAQGLGSSVIPIFRAFGSMDGLNQAVIRAAVERLHEYLARRHTEVPFRNAGVGLVMFARDEPELYKTLFIERSADPGIFRHMMEYLRTAVEQTPVVSGLDERVRDELIVDMWVYTHGLASMIVAGLLPAPSAEAIDKKLTRIGTIVIGATLRPLSKKRGGRP
jgi:AcrR family transcriptional regulator